MKTSYIVLGTIAVLLGLLIGQTDIFMILQFGMLLGGILFLSLLGIVGGAISNKKEITRIGFIGMLLVLIACFSMMATSGLTKAHSKRQSQEMIRYINLYKTKHGNYPQKLSEIDFHYNIEDFSYHLDSSQQHFKLSYIVDGWHYREYSSETKTWETGD